MTPLSGVASSHVAELVAVHGDAELLSSSKLRVCAGIVVPLTALKLGVPPEVIESLSIDYTVGGGQNRTEQQELIIYSWDRTAEPAGLF